MMRKKGDKVIVRKDLDLNKHSEGWNLLYLDKKMLEYSGKQLTIKDVFLSSYTVKGNPYCWTDSMFDIPKSEQKYNLQEKKKYHKGMILEARKENWLWFKGTKLPVLRSAERNLELRMDSTPDGNIKIPYKSVSKLFKIVKGVKK